MDTIEYMKRFIKFLLSSQIIGFAASLLFAISPDNPYVILFFCLAAGFIMAYFFFMEVHMTLSLYLLSILLYLLMTVVSIIPVALGAESLVWLFIWNIIFGFFLGLVVAARRLIPILSRSLQQNAPAQFSGIRLSSIKVSPITKGALAVFAIVLIWSSVSWWTGSNKEERCRELRSQASDYRALIAEHRSMAEHYERKAEGYIDRYGPVKESLLAGADAQLRSFGHSGQAAEDAQRLAEIEKKMRELGCE